MDEGEAAAIDFFIRTTIGEVELGGVSLHPTAMGEKVRRWYGACARVCACVYAAMVCVRCACECARNGIMGRGERSRAERRRRREKRRQGGRTI